MKRGTMQIINTEAIKGTQDLLLTAYAKNLTSPDWKGQEVRWRATLKRDFYDFQCSFRVERWDGTKWREVYTVLDRSNLRIMKHSSQANVEKWRADAEADALDLLNLAASLVS